MKSLLAVVDSGSIAEAARTEHLTAAAIGQRVQVLERELGFALLSRSGHTAQPTPACERLIARARRLVREAALLQGDASADGLGGSLRIGAVSTALTGLLPGALRHFTRAAPQARVLIVPGTSRALYRMLQAGEIDAALIAAPPFDLPRTLHAMELRHEPLMLLAPKGTRGSPAALLRRMPYIRYDPSAWGGRHAAQWLADRELAPAVLCDLDALEAIALLVADGMGVSLVPQWPGIERFAGDCRAVAIAGAAYARSMLLVRALAPDFPQTMQLLERSLQAGGDAGAAGAPTRAR
ncbi:LysR substrate-binding domain-containing protein [Comamonas endophytica]|uniref:LysR substrate-binding domain-containing protein n=1 Tax=Comamonas endophytica TaxID=2949090 RepID=UPI001E38CF5C|nr:LysR substrate-binding domain-containing protein [Acidovorax sp. D4N7]MCD2514421.1 LysR substrate-binding domain-containing protein [Acidovorax sp. D4N7]